MKVENRLDDIQNKRDEAAQRKNSVTFSGPNTPTVAEVDPVQMLPINYSGMSTK